MPGRITEEWLNEAFAPLASYLEKHHPEEAARIAEYLMFMNNDEGLYLYKNRLSRAQIAFDEEGELLYCQESALAYRYSWSPDYEEEVCAGKEEIAVREQANDWLQNSLSPFMRKSYEEAVRRFLQELWGPLTDYRFENLKSDSPVRTLSPNPSLYLYWDRPPERLAFEFLSSGVAEAGKREELRRRRELVAANGWTVFTLTREALERHLPILREQLRLELKKADAIRKRKD